MNPGDIFHEKYRIDGHLGSGGQSSVFRAEEIETGRRVAIKLMHDSGHGVRFIREGRVVSKLAGPHVVRLLEFDRAPSGQFFMVFEFIAGDNLAKLARAEAPLPWARVARLVRQILDALAEAHELGIVHRDIKPSNIMLAPGEEVRVLDFGVAKLSEGEQQAITQTGEVLGTPRYVAPEALRGDEVTPRADVYAVGLVAWELLAGRPANDERHSADIVLRHLDDAPYRLPADVELPEEARQWLVSMCHKNPRMRPPDARAALAELDQFYVAELPDELDGPTGEHERPTDLPPPVLSEPTATVVGALHQSGPQQPPPPQPKSRGLPPSIRLDPSRPFRASNPRSGVPTWVPITVIVALLIAIAAMVAFG